MSSCYMDAEWLSQDVGFVVSCSEEQGRWHFLAFKRPDCFTLKM